MVNAFPQSATDLKALLLTYEKALTGLSDTAIIEAATRFIIGDVADQSKTFAPSIAEFVGEARNRQEFIDIKSQQRLPAPKYTPGPIAPFQIRQQKTLTKYQNCPVIAENVSFDQWKLLSAKKEVPVGAVWVASLGIVFGPEPKRSEAAA